MNPLSAEGVKVLPYGNIGPAFGEATEEGSFRSSSQHIKPASCPRPSPSRRRRPDAAEAASARLRSSVSSFLDSFDDQVQGALDLQQLTEWQQRLQASSAGVAARMLHVIKQGRAGSSRLDEPE